MKHRFLCTVFLVTAQALASPQFTFKAAPINKDDQPDVKSALGLSDEQLRTLQKIESSQQDAGEAIYAEITRKQQYVDQLLTQEPADVAAVGRLLVEMRDLKHQLASVRKSFRDQALALFQTDQTAKLNTLREALHLQKAVWQAVQLNLLEALESAGAEGSCQYKGVYITIPTDVPPGGNGELRLLGELVEGGTECQRFRTSDNKFYTLQGDLKRFHTGDHVEITAVLAEVSFCMQDKTLLVKTIRKV